MFTSAAEAAVVVAIGATMSAMAARRRYFILETPWKRQAPVRCLFVE
jgi:hypothetical protein